MSRFMQRARSLIGRAVGTGRLERTMQEGFAALEARVATAEGETAAWRRSCDERLDRIAGTAAGLRSALDALDSQVGGQGRANTERGEAARNALVDIRTAVAGIRSAESLGRALDDMRVELSRLRLDIARELDAIGGRPDSGGA